MLKSILTYFIFAFTFLVNFSEVSAQKKRILVFLGQGSNNKERYQIEQSKIAVGSGGLWGKGYLKGTQNQLSFLPESRTDFIFSIICEEFGLAGASFILFLFLLLFMRLFYMISLIQSFYPGLMCIGLLIHIILSTQWQHFYCIG